MAQTRVLFLNELKDFVEDVSARFLLPTSVQKGDACNHPHEPTVYRMRLPHSREWKKAAPYILLQIVTGADVQKPGEYSDSTAQVRFIFCTYNEDEEEGALDLLNLMEAVRIALLEENYIGRGWELDRTAALESLVYPDDTAPYYAGEMMGTFSLPEIERRSEINGKKASNFPRN